MSIVRLSTADGAVTDPRFLWSDVIGSRIGTVVTDTFGAPEFDALHDYEILGPIHLCRIVAGPHRVVRPAGPAPEGGKGLAAFNLQIAGRSSLAQAGREVRLGPGEWTMFDAVEPFTVCNTSDVDQLCLLAPRRLLTCGGDEFRRLVAERFSGVEGIGGMVFGLALSVFETAPRSHPDVLEGLAGCLTDLLNLALRERARSESNASLREAWRTRIKHHIRQHLTDPDLSLDSIAGALHCTKRYLHGLFRDEDETLGRYIWNLRLEHCRMNLADARHADQTIAEIAFGWGFNSPTHFSQLFKERFGLSPRSYREQAGLTEV